MSAVVVGNGASRAGFSLADLHAVGTLFGCNALYRDHMPDYLAAVDPPMIQEILDLDVQTQCQFYIPSNLNQWSHIAGINYATLNFPTSQMDSGTLATVLAAEFTEGPIYLIGFDYVSHTGFQNNMYAGTPNYREAQASHVTQATLDSWHYRSMLTMLMYRNRDFVRVNTNGYEPPFQLENYVNISADEFREHAGILYTAREMDYQNLDRRRYLRQQVHNRRPTPIVTHTNKTTLLNPYADATVPDRPRWYR